MGLRQITATCAPSPCNINVPNSGGPTGTTENTPCQQLLQLGKRMGVLGQFKPCGLRSEVPNEPVHVGEKLRDSHRGELQNKRTAQQWNTNNATLSGLLNRKM